MKALTLSPAQKLSVFIIDLYRKSKPFLDNLILVSMGWKSECKHNPSCSEYTIRAVQRYGTMRGLFMGMHRILSCR
jgi:putative component of membrane protein insertase Oxa1/YidC/SpoIIIJ protein YidD